MSGKRRAEGSVTKKRRLWYAVLTLGRTSNGGQERQWSRGFRTRREAERKLAQLLVEERKSKETSETVAGVVRQYIEHDVTSSGKRSPTTTLRYWGLLTNMAPIHDERVDQLDGPIVESLYSQLLQDGLSHTTVHHVHNLLSAACRWAQKKRVHLITRNPFEFDEIERPRRAKSNAHALTIAHARRALQCIANTKHANALVFSLATACRRGETCGLRWCNVDLRRRVATICESRYQAGHNQGQKATKADRVREVPLNLTAIQAIRREKSRQDRRRRVADDCWVESGHVFTDELGKPISPMALTNAFSRCAKQAGLPTTRMHDLRHTAATFILSAGGNPTAATRILGHSEQSTTLRIYGHVIGSEVVRAAHQIDKVLTPARRKAAAHRAKRR